MICSYGRFAFFLVLLSANAGCSHVSSAPVSSSVTLPPDVSEGALMIVIDDPRSERRRRGIESPGYDYTLHYQEDPTLKRAAQKMALDHGLNLVAQWPLRNLAVHCLVVEAATSDTLAALNNDPRVRWVQPFNEFATQTMPGETAARSQRAFKELFSELPELGSGVRIAVVDTSVAESHPDFSESTIRQLNFAGKRGRLRSEEHGTAVVGLIAATSNDSQGVTGLANEADVQVLRACWQAAGDSVGKCNTLTLALALDAAIDLRPAVLNLSLTGQYDRVLEELITVLLDAGTIVIAAYDDQRHSSQRFPAAQTGVVYAFGGSNASNPSNQPNGLVLRAPRHAMSLAPGADYDLVSGHSIAAPHISALAARLIENRPRASRAQILQQLADWLGPQDIISAAANQQPARNGFGE